MLTIKFENQDQYEGLVNKFQKEFILDNVSEVLMIGDESKYVSLNMYFFIHGSEKAQAMINAPARIFYQLDRVMKKAAFDHKHQYELTISCIMSKWAVSAKVDNTIRSIDEISGIAA